MKFIFGIQINMEVFYKLILSFFKHAQSIQNNKFAISLQYLKKDVSDEVDFLHADKRKGLLQIDTMILMEISIPKFPKIASFQCLYNTLRKKLERDEVDFWISFKVSWKLISTLWPSTFPRKWYYHWYSWSSIL